MSKADKLIDALRSLATEALTDADSFTASDFSCTMSALAENFQALDAAMLNRDTPHDWQQCEYCEGHHCQFCQHTGMARYNPAILEATELIRVKVHDVKRCSSNGWEIVTRIRKNPDGALCHFVRGSWIELHAADHVENFVALNKLWSQYPPTPTKGEHQ